MTEQDKQDILKDVANALDTVPFGKIIIELRGDSNHTDVLVEHRRRHTHKKRT